MSSKSATILAVCLLLAFAVGGCRKTQPVTAADTAVADDVETSLPSKAATAATEPPEAEDPWGWDLEEINRRLHGEGLLSDVYFDYDRAELRAEARAQLESNARFLRENPQFVVAIEGHCDERGTVDYNLALGQLRAGASRQYVEVLGVPGGQLRAMSFGKERPQCTDPDEACWSRNRRAHFVVVERTGQTG